ncbi:MAG: RluA family pseudouridine synthase [Oscillospiraceae bacterium]|nr:RluA family pseudouridine synthase [Oscillospiraceae bacterium]
MENDNTVYISAETCHNGTRIDKLLSEYCSDISRSMAVKMLESGLVTVDGKAVKKSYIVSEGDEISAIIPEPEIIDVVPENIPIEIVYEDSSLLVVNKPQGMVVHPAPRNYSGTLVNALMYHCVGKLSSINGIIRPGIVHRIDKNTGGLLMVAKTDEAHTFLAEQIKTHSFTREYEAIVCGHLPKDSDTVNAPIGRHPVDRKKMAVTEKNSREAITHYTVIRGLKGYTHVRLRLETGRTHQIRVHMAYIGHPIIGDDVYGKPFKGLLGQCLFAKKIGFIHPISREYMEFESPLPDYFTETLERLT